MAKIHLILQGKGGVGKSFIATILAQYKRFKGQPTLCIDTDPVNATFAGFQALDVCRLKIMENNEIHSRVFDDLIEKIVAATGDVIIDNGAASFVPLSHYLLSNQVPSFLQTQGHELIIHTVITGGQALTDTLNGFTQLVQQFPEDLPFFLWLNPYWGAVKSESKDFEQMKAYIENKHRISALIHIPSLKAETFGRDLSDMLQERLTFDEAIALPSRTLMTRQRLKMIRDQLYAQLDLALSVL